jgi:hypothetical protein
MGSKPYLGGASIGKMESHTSNATQVGLLLIKLIYNMKIT